MSDSEPIQVIQTQINSAEVEKLKGDLNDWKYILLPLNKLLEWEHQFDPLIILVAVSAVFGILMAWSPSVLTTISLIGLIAVSVDFLVPLITHNFLKSVEWTVSSDIKYTKICERISNFLTHVSNLKLRLMTMRQEKQSLYFLSVLFFLIFCIYVGQSFDNLLLSYLVVTILCLLPGARRRNLTEKVTHFVKSLMKGKKKSE